VNFTSIAAFLAVTARMNTSIPQRGALIIEDQDEEPVAAAIFGKDDYESDGRTRLEVDYLRQQLRDRGVEELAFGLSPDGFAWVLLVRSHECRYRTLVGKAFQMEMFKYFLDDLVQLAWSNACAV
jgi:hypothetical protein